MSVRLEELLSKVGRPGKYQLLVFGVLQLQYAFLVAYLASLSFWAIAPDIDCQSITSINSTIGVLRIGEDLCSTKEGNVIDGNIGNGSGEECQTLHGYRYSGNLGFSSVAMEWDLLCHRKYTVRILQTVFFCGAVIGGVVFGPLADHFGRRPISIFTIFGSACLGIVISFLDNLYAYAACKILQAVLLQGFNSATNCIKTEILHGKYRAKVIAFADALALSLPMYYLAGVAHFTSHWRYVELAISIPLLLTFGSIWIVPESFRWLLKKKRPEEAMKVIERYAKFNKIQVPANARQEVDAIIAEIDDESDMQRGYDMRDLFSTPRLAMYSLVFGFSWFTWLLVNYGVMFSMSSLSGNLFMNFVILGMVDFVFRSGSYFLLLKMESKTVTCLGLFCTGVFLLVTCLVRTFAGHDAMLVGVISTILAMFGRACIGIFVVASYILLSEVFPTSLRATAYGSFFALGRIGALLSSQIIALGDMTSWTELPFLILAVCGMVAGILNLLLPNTRNQPLPNTINETLHLHDTKKPLTPELIIKTVANEMTEIKPEKSIKYVC